MTTELTEQGLSPESIARQLVSEIRADPRVRELVLRELLTEDFLRLPEAFQRLVEWLDELTKQVNRLAEENLEFRESTNRRLDGLEQGQQRLADSVQRLDEGQQRLADSVQRLDEGQQRLADSVQRLDEGQQRLADSVQRLDEGQQRLSGQVGNLRGGSYETRCTEDIELVLVDYVDKPVLANRDDIRAALVQARRNGVISRAQFDRARMIDIIAAGAELDSGRPILAIVEASITINEYDVSAAQERAAILLDVTGQDTRPFCVANAQWSDALADAAEELGVTLIRYEMSGFDFE